MTRAMSILSIQGYNMEEGVLGLIAMPTFIFLDLICEISSAIASGECNASMWKQYKSASAQTRKVLNTSASIGKDIDPLIRIREHHMTIEECARGRDCFTQSSDDRRANRDVGDCHKSVKLRDRGIGDTKMSVHDVNVKPVCAMI
jgi:hypothetical protein